MLADNPFAGTHPVTSGGSPEVAGDEHWMWEARVLKRSEGKRKLTPLCGTVNSEKLPLLSDS